MKFQFIQPVYHYYEIEADSLEEAYEKTDDTTEADCYDIVIGGWEDTTPNECPKFEPAKEEYEQ
jgi:hypothetical protein